VRPTTPRISSTLAVAALALGATGCRGGGDEGANEQRFDGEKQRIAAVIDDLQAASQKGDAARICEDLFSNKLADQVTEETGSTCSARVDEQIVGDDVTFHVDAVELRGEKNAIARVTDQQERRSVLYLARGGEAGWEITDIAR
jgi:hypothetical protein